MHSFQLLLLTSLDSGLGDLASLVLLDNRLDDTDSNSLSHVTDGEATKRRIIGKCLNAHWLGWNHLDNGSITRLDELGRGFSRLAGTTINLLEKLRELASNVGSVAIEDWGIASTNLTRVVKNNDLSVERFGTLWRIVLLFTSNIATTNFLDRDVLDIEADIITRKTLDELFVVHLNGLDFGCNTSWGKDNNHTGPDDTSFNTADWHSSNAANLVNILKRKTEWLVSWASRWVNGINCLEKSLSGDLGLGLLLPTLVPWAVGGVVDHVITIKTRDWDEWNMLWVVADLLDEVGSFLDDFVETSLGPLGSVHLVDSNNELLDTKSVGKQSMLTSLTILGDTSLELTSTSSNDENGAISLGSSSDHVLDEITMSWGINDGDIVLWGFKLPEGNINSDTTLTLSLEFVKHPRILEGSLAEFGSFLLELLNRTLIDSTALVDQMAGSG